MHTKSQSTRGSIDRNHQIRMVLTDHDIPRKLLAQALRDVSNVLALQGAKIPTAAKERDALRSFADRAKALQHAWYRLARSTKLSIGAADYESFDEFEGKLELVQERATALLGTHEFEESAVADDGNSKVSKIVVHRRGAREYKGRPPVDRKREVLGGLCVIWLRYAEMGRQCTADGVWRRGAKNKMAVFVNDVIEAASGDTARESNDRMLRRMYDRAMSEARKLVKAEKRKK